MKKRKPNLLQIEQNKRQSRLLIGCFLGLMLLLGVLIGGVAMLVLQTSWTSLFVGGFLFLSVAIIYVIIQYKRLNRLFFKPGTSLLITEDNDPILYHIVEDMAMTAKIPVPQIYLVNDASMNAFATGSDPEHAVIGVTVGLRDRLNREELEGVIAHEMAHIKNYDIRLSCLTVALSTVFVSLGWILLRVGPRLLNGRKSSSDSKNYGALIGLVMTIAGGLLLLVGVPLAKILQFALSREREYLADATGVRFTRNPQGLIRALTKISGDEIKSTVLKDSPAAALCINEPKVEKKKAFWSGLFNTHPDTKDRIERLGGVNE